MAKVVVLGGGYSGLACLIELSKSDRELDLHLIDASAEHCKVTNLHKTFRQPLAKFTLPYTRLAEKFHFTFHQQHLSFNQQDLQRWQTDKQLPLGDVEFSFDWLVVSTGALPAPLPNVSAATQQANLRGGEGCRFLEGLLDEDAEQVTVTLVGGGATGIQVLFELYDELKRKRRINRLRLVDMHEQLIPDLPMGVHNYIFKKMRRLDIEYLPGTRYLTQHGSSIELEELDTGRKFTRDSDRILFFSGVAPAPVALQTNAFGQILSEGQPLEHLFSAGDCAKYEGPGLNHQTGQAAVRKGKIVARNIIALCRGRQPQAYRYQEKGYILSLGALDAIGWIGLRCNLVKGFPASLIKDAMEVQYDLLLDGIDTYVDFFG